MAKTKRNAPREIPEHIWQMLHGGYVTAGRELSLDGPPSLRDLARPLGIPFAEADRRATVEHWEEERGANEARTWMAEFGKGATTEAEFLERHTRTMYAHVEGTPEGDRWIQALARRQWAWYTARVSIWESIKEEAAAHEALDAARERDRGCATCPRRAA